MVLTLNIVAIVHIWIVEQKYLLKRIMEKKIFLKSFLSDVFIYEEEQKDGRILKGLRFKFPIYMNGRNVLGVDWDNESTDEEIWLL